MKIMPLVFLGILLLANTAVAAENHLIHYAPEVVRLTGKIKEITCPGPPNYENINNGDKPERYGYLFLERPVNIDSLPNAADLSAGFNKPENDVKVIQLVLDANAYHWSLVRAGKYVFVKGTLFSWITGHHHTPVLIECSGNEGSKILSKRTSLSTKN